MLSRLHNSDTDAPNYPRILRISIYAPQGIVKKIVNESPDMGILSLARKGKDDTEYQSLISAIVGGQELLGPLSPYKPLYLHKTIQDFSSGQLIITNDQQIVIPKMQGMTF